MNRAPEEYARDGQDSGARRGFGGSERRNLSSGDPIAASAQSAPAPARDRLVRILAGDHVLTLNPVDGSEVEPCPPGSRPGTPVRSSPDVRERRNAETRPPSPVGRTVPHIPLLGREEERMSLHRLLSQGRSVRVTGPAGSGRSSLLEAVAGDCADLAPDGVVRVSGRHRAALDLLHELFALFHDAADQRPGRERLLETVRGIGAVIVVDDLEFGGSALDELLDAVPDCALLISATPDVPAPSANARVEELFLTGLSRSDSLDVLARAAQRPLDGDEAAWAADLWFESEGLPLRFLQAAAILRNRDAALPGRNTSESDEEFFAAFEPLAALTPLPPLAEAAAPVGLLAGRLSEPARSALRFAVALGGECPDQTHLPALTGDAYADAALGELLDCGLVTAAGPQYRLAAGVLAQLEASGHGTGAVERARATADHYARWAEDGSVTPGRVAAEASVVLAALGALVAGRDPVHAAAAVRLARSTAPMFAAALQWSAWERVLRQGQEAARISGDVPEEAYFHHEFGVLALCSGSVDRARAELEASIALRGALADKHGAVAGRRALALVEDHTQGFDHVTGTSTPPAGTRVGTAALGQPAGERTEALPTAAERAAANRAAAIESLRAARREGPDSIAGGLSAARAADESSGLRLFDTPAKGEAVGVPDERMPEPLGQRPGVHRKHEGRHRNAVAIGAGALLTAVLGTVVALGSSSGRDDGRGGRTHNEQPDAGGDAGGGDLFTDDPWAGSGDRDGSGGAVGSERREGAGAGARSVSDRSPSSDDPGGRERKASPRPGTPSDDPGTPTDRPTQKPSHPSDSPEPSESSPSESEDPVPTPTSSPSEIVEIPLGE
ncbi:ATP-binding protein [Streptomyces meridianus]|uniref:ATP-binding protein n=1 Tax=Streptomyces meridianus TaxID=2938945 RepID=A0ABT0X6K6_9ACTN|nr:ATP-binding protein [Streptomyces meridianus]MCM2578152.1 ATP-binding protein [Streptomyces meridianus]